MVKQKKGLGTHIYSELKKPQVGPATVGPATAKLCIWA